MHQHPTALVGWFVAWSDFWLLSHLSHTINTLLHDDISTKKMINNFSTFNNCLLHTSYNTIEPIKNICGLWGGMLWLIYGTVNSVESGEFTGAVKYLLDHVCVPNILFGQKKCPILLGADLFPWAFVVDCQCTKKQSSTREKTQNSRIELKTNGKVFFTPSLMRLLWYLRKD